MALKKKSKKEEAPSMKPIKKSKMKTITLSKAAEEEKKAKIEEEKIAKETPKEEELTCAKPYERVIWAEVPNQKVDSQILSKILRTVGEIEDISNLDDNPLRFEVTFTTKGSVRQAMLLHGRVVSQLPCLTDKKDKSSPLFTESEAGGKLSIDLALPLSHRVVIRNIPTQCENEEVSAALQKFGTVAYVYRNNRKSFGFAAFTTVSAVKRATEAEVVIIREKTISIEAYKSEGGTRNWQDQQQNQALQYLRSLVPLNQYVLPSPTKTPSEVPASSSNAISPFSLTPAAPPKLAAGKKSNKGKSKTKRDESPATAPKPAIKRKKKSSKK
eukprot:TRINITY_DN5078_c0_g1_i1.p1 TRINITY_DN5078_c0_g1~~TRINITY_DN5078_c0_g1_i1.p1  ORF type:complete len:349 (+),score=77.16 TRINITY_DN5078_c0_g1_i1:65-1048(+)